MCDTLVFGITKRRQAKRSRRGQTNERGIKPLFSKSSRSKGGGGKDTTESENGGGVPGERADHAECHVPHPCIIAFGGSALRPGGGYSEAKLHVLEDPPPESNAKVFEDSELDEEAMTERRKSSLAEEISGDPGATTKTAVDQQVSDVREGLFKRGVGGGRGAGRIFK